MRKWHSNHIQMVNESQNNKANAWMWKYNEKHEQKKRKKKPQSTHLESSSPAKIREKTPQFFPSPFLIFSPSSSSFNPSDPQEPASHTSLFPFFLLCFFSFFLRQPSPTYSLCLMSHLAATPSFFPFFCSPAFLEKKGSPLVFFFFFKKKCPRRELNSPPEPPIKGVYKYAPLR